MTRRFSAGDRARVVDQPSRPHLADLAGYTGEIVGPARDRAGAVDRLRYWFRPDRLYKFRLGVVVVHVDELEPAAPLAAAC